MTQQRVRVKYCGITRPEDARAAVDAGADAIGLVFYAKSPRAVTIEQAIAVAAQIPPFVSLVGLFVNADPKYIKQVRDHVRLNLLQFHGDESAKACDQYDCDWVKAVRMQPSTNFDEISETYSKAKALLLDAYDPDQYGGTGEIFDWTMIPKERKLPVILAGGLIPDNVGRAITQVRPYAVDVSGGIESAKGVKDVKKMNAFMRGVISVSE